MFFLSADRFNCWSPRETNSLEADFISRMQRLPTKIHADRSPAYFFGKVSTRADIAVFFSVPPTINGPMGVNAIPRVSARTS